MAEFFEFADEALDHVASFVFHLVEVRGGLGIASVAKFSVGDHRLGPVGPNRLTGRLGVVAFVARNGLEMLAWSARLAADMHLVEEGFELRALVLLARRYGHRDRQALAFAQDVEFR